MPSRTARQTRNVCTYAKVIYVDAIPDHLTISDVIGMGPGRPTWEQVRKMELIIEIREDGTPMPIMPLLPEFDSLSDDETGLSTRFYAALYATAHRFVTGVRAKRSYAEAYVSALTHYLQTFTSCDYFTLLDIEVKAGRTESAAERSRCVRSRRAESVHNTLVSFVVLGGRCGRLAA